MAKKTVKKQILRVGEWAHDAAPDGILKITKNYLKELVNTFKKHNPFTPISKGHQDNTDLNANPSLIASKNVKDLFIEGDGLYAEFDIDEEVLDKYNDVSVRIRPDYKDTKTGEVVGDALEHIALVTSPHLKNLDPFVALEDENTNKPSYLINLSDINMEDKEKEVSEEVEETKEEEKLESEEESTVEENEEVDESDSKPDKPEKDEGEDEEEEASKEPTDSKDEESEEEVDASDDQSDADVEKLRDEVIQLREQLARSNEKKMKAEAENRYKDLSDAGKLTPAQKDSFVDLYVEAGSKEIDLEDGAKGSLSSLIDKLFEKAPKIIEFEEKGVDVETGGAPAVDPKLVELKDEMRNLEAHKDKSDEEFNEWFENNKDTISASLRVKG